VIGLPKATNVPLCKLDANQVQRRDVFLTQRNEPSAVSTRKGVRNRRRNGGSGVRNSTLRLSGGFANAAETTRERL
jgi:hypothetical protein